MRGRFPHAAPAAHGAAGNVAVRMRSSYHGCVPADVTSRDDSPGPAARAPARGLLLLRRLAGPVLFPTPTSLRRLALAGVVANAGIVATGAAVRLSNSGLGCLDWPDCTKSSLLAAPRAGEPLFHTWIEFGNRLVTAVVMIVAVLVAVAAWRFRPPGSPRRRTDLAWLATLQVIAIPAQAVIGGIVVLTKLSPPWVSGHFMLSVAVVAAAVVLHVRCTEGGGRARPLVRTELRWLGAGMIAVVVVMLAAGTVVTGTGPLAGAPGVPRYHLPLVSVTQFHADVGWVLGGVTFALLLGLRLTNAPDRILRLGYLLIGMLATQGAIGYIQYFAHLPAGLVWVHESSAMLIWIVALRLVFALRDRGRMVPDGMEAPAPGAAAATATAPAG